MNLPRPSSSSICPPVFLQGTELEFRQEIAHEFVEGSAIAPELFEAVVQFASDTEISDGGDCRDAIADFLNWDRKQAGFSSRRNGFAALLHNEDGSPWQAKLNYQVWDSEKGKYGKPYKVPKNNGSRAYLPPLPEGIRQRISQRHGIEIPLESGFWEFVEAHPEIPIVLTEGGKKSLSALSHGYVSVALYGCNSGYRRAGGRRLLIDDLKRFCQPGRKFTIAFDQDLAPKTQRRVTAAVRRMDELLRSEADGIGVRVAAWDGAIAKGVDDLIVAQGVGAIDKAVAEAKGLLEKSTWIPGVCQVLTQPPYNWSQYGGLAEFLKSVPAVWQRESIDDRLHKEAWLGLCGLHLPQTEFQEALNAEVVAAKLTPEQAEARLKELESSAFKIVRNLLATLRKADDFETIAKLKGRCVSGIINSDKILSDYTTLVKLGDRLRFNTLKKQIELDEKPVQVGMAKVDLTVNESLQFRTKTEFEAIFVKAAKRNSYSPIVEYLDRVSNLPSIDTSILDNAAERFFGRAEPIYQSMLKRFLIGAVARVYQPGCKNDCALILQGKQGAGKSSFFKILAGGDDYFDDSLGNPTDKDEKLKLHQTWVTEWAELESVFRRKDVAATKAFLSSSVDNIRPPYGRDTVAMPRQSVIVGTTNQEEFLSDTTGSRRFWVVPVEFVDLELLRSERDRIWAAAVALYKAGERWWLDSGEDVAAATVAADFQMADPWTEPVLEYAESRDLVTVRGILLDALQVETGKQDKAAQMRVAAILTQAGYKRGTRSRAHGRQVVWFQPAPEPETIEHPQETIATIEAAPEPEAIEQQQQPQPRHPHADQISQWVRSAGLTGAESKELRQALFGEERWKRYRDYSEQEMEQLRIAISLAGRRKKLDSQGAEACG